jgi:hypothetical protein
MQSQSIGDTRPGPRIFKRTLTSLRLVLLEGDPHHLQHLETAFKSLVNLKEYVGIPISKSILDIFSATTLFPDRVEIYLDDRPVVGPLIHAIHTAPLLSHVKSLSFRADAATQS